MVVKRDSNFELLRIICYFGIVLLHVYGNFMPNATGVARMGGIAINCLFNTGVSIFILISGYYGIRLSSRKKLISFWLCLLFYSLLVEMITQSVNGIFNFRGIIVACFPIFTRKWWYMSTYILLMIFSPWINRIVHTLSEKEFLKLLFTLLMIFSIIPSCIGWTFFGDGGKGIGNLLSMYLLGQYFSKYCPNKYKINRKYCVYIGIVTFGIMMLLTTVKTVLKRDIGIEGPFFRDASILTVILSVCIFLFFMQCKISSKTINYIAKRGVGIYVLDCTIIDILLKKFSVSQTIIGILYCMGIVLFIMAIGVLTDSCRLFLAHFFEKYIIQVIEFFMDKAIAILNDFGDLMKKMGISEY